VDELISVTLFGSVTSDGIADFIARLVELTQLVDQARR
jgi:hypothetical protein